MKRFQFLKMKQFIGKKVYNLLFLSIFAGVSWFLVELSFIYIFQYFLYSLKLIDSSQLSFKPEIFGSNSKTGICLLISFGILRFITSFLKTVMSSFVQHTFVQEKRSLAIELALQNAGRVSTGFILSVFSEIISQSGTVLFYVSNSLISIISTTLFIVAGFCILPFEMFISLSLLFLFLFPYKILNKRIVQSGQILTSEWEQVNTSIINLIKNNLFIKIYNLAGKESLKARRSLEKYEHNYKSYTVNYALVTLLPPAYGLIIVSIVSMIFIGKEESAPINLVSFLYLFLRMSQSASETLGTISFIKLNAPSFKKLYDWVSTYKNQAKSVEVFSNVASIKFKDVNFSYELASAPLFHPLNFCFSTGDIVVIKGPSGAGKSTLLSLIMGIQKATTGIIEINGIKNESFSLAAQIGYVGPTPYLNTESVRNNLLYGTNKEINDEKIWKVLDSVGLKGIIEQLPKKLDEELNEEAQFSTGQKQRLCIARTLLQTPQILILDEATANLDADSEEIILERIKESKDQRITIIVTHKGRFDNDATQFLNIKPI